MSGLRARLTLIYGGLFFAAGALLLTVTYALFNQQLQQPARMLVNLDNKLTKPTTDPKASTSATPVPTPSRNPTPPSDQPYIISSNGEHLSGPAAQKWLGEQQERLHHAASVSLLTQGGIALALVGGVAASSGWLVAGRVLAPLHRVTETARRIAAAPAADRSLHERIALRGPQDEVKELADTFDTMVERLDRSFDSQRRFIANASHELRTPLTVGRALVDVAMHRKTASEDVKQLGENLLQINARHERLINGLLLLATSENELGARHPVDLADVVPHVVAQLSNEAEHAGIVVRQDAGEALTTGDAVLLERLVHNLVENGIRHNVRAGDGERWVEIRSRTLADGRAELEVSNTGPEIPAYEIPALFEPFHRLAPDRLVTDQGAGLGLSIVRSVTRNHDGDVTACPRQGGGLVVTVTLPSCPGEPAI